MTGRRRRAGDYAEAERLHRRALEIMEKRHGGDHPSVARVLLNLAALHETTEAYDDAVAETDRALSIVEQRLGPDDRGVAKASLLLARIALARGDTDEGLRQAERAVVLAEARGLTEPKLAHARFVLARALVDAGGSLLRARVLAEEAVDSLAAAGPPEKATLKRAKRWLRAHPAGS